MRLSMQAANLSSASSPTGDTSLTAVSLCTVSFSHKEPLRGAHMQGPVENRAVKVNRMSKIRCTVFMLFYLSRKIIKKIGFFKKPAPY